MAKKLVENWLKIGCSTSCFEQMDRNFDEFIVDHSIRKALDVKLVENWLKIGVNW